MHAGRPSSNIAPLVKGGSTRRIRGRLRPNNVHRFELTPNCSLTMASALVFYLGIGAVSLSVAVGFAIAGYWPILPFAGLELLALGAALRWSLLQGQRRELISVEESRVLVRKTGRKRQYDFEFVRPWTRVELVEARATT